MSHCEPCQAELSAALDGELDAQRSLAVLDHLVDCRHCRAFYRQGRALDGLLVASGRAPSRQELPAEGWRRIAERLRASPPSRWQGPVPFQLAAAAAVALFIVIAVVLAPLPRRPATDVRTAGLESQQQEGLADVVVGSKGERMSDERFLALAREILESDRRHRREIVDLLTAVESRVEGERTTEESAPTAEHEPRRGGSSWDGLEGESRESEYRGRLW